VAALLRPDAANLIWAADGPLATKLTRDTIHVLRRHPLCGGMLPPKPGQKRFWVTGATDARNASMEAVGVDSNATGLARRRHRLRRRRGAEEHQDAEARANLRAKIEDSTHIAVPGAQKTYIGTPHTHDSIYSEKIEGGAAVLKIRSSSTRSATRTRAAPRATAFDFDVGPDGLYVLSGIGKFARMLVEGVDYQVEGREIVFDKPPHAVLDICAACAWPERFTRKDIEIRRKATKTLNAWDSQYGSRASRSHRDAPRSREAARVRGRARGARGQQRGRYVSRRRAHRGRGRLLGLLARQGQV
jgi:hypothetical protein